MPHVKVEIPHQLGEEEAARRLKDKSDLLRESYGSQISDLQQQWNGNVLSYSFKTMGVAIKGSLTAGPSDVKIDVELPWLAMAFRGTIESKVRDEVGKLLV
jgi:putative polyhydroxyalkanoate system protein